MKQLLQILQKKMDAMAKVLNELKEEQNKVSQLVEENTKLKENVSELEKRVLNLEQRSRLSNIEITGVPVAHKESTDAPMKIGEKIGMAILPNDIIISHRVLTRKTGQPANIVCQLRDRRLKGSWMTAYKNFLKENKESGLQAIHLHEKWQCTMM